MIQTETTYGDKREVDSFLTGEIWDMNPYDWAEENNLPEDSHYAPTLYDFNEEDVFHWFEYWDGKDDSLEEFVLGEIYKNDEPVYIRVWNRGRCELEYDGEYWYGSDYAGAPQCEEYVYVNGKCVHNSFEGFKINQDNKEFASPRFQMVENLNGDTDMAQYPL